MTHRIKNLSLQALQVTPKTIWLVLSVTDDEGRIGLGEASLGLDDSDLIGMAGPLRESLLGQPLAAGAALIEHLPFGTLAHAAWSSAVMQAVCDLLAQAGDVPMTVLLGGQADAMIPCYANINRRIDDRSPQGFAGAARDAQAAGFTAFKIAPFDAITPEINGATIDPLLSAGLARIEAVREAVGPQARLMVDCHWRFNAQTARRMMAAVMPYRLHWIECPIAESKQQIADLLMLRKAAHAQNALLAGLETAIRQQGFAPYLTAGAYDVMMPDVKYAGGPWEMLAIAKDFERHGTRFSPHNPTGPICHAASLHVCAAVGNLDRLETQFGETLVFGELVAGSVPTIVGGRSALPGTRPGLGITLDDAVVSRHLLRGLASES